MDKLVHALNHYFGWVPGWFAQHNIFLKVLLLLFGAVFGAWIFYRVFVKYPRSLADKALEFPVQPKPKPEDGRGSEND